MDKYSNLEISKNLRKYMTALMARSDITSRCFGKEMLDFNRYLYEPETKIPENYTISSIIKQNLVFEITQKTIEQGIWTYFRVSLPQWSSGRLSSFYFYSA